MKKSFMTRVLATGLSLAMAFSLSAATNVTTAAAASKPKMITLAGASAKNLSVEVGEKTQIKINATDTYKISDAKPSSNKLRVAKNKAGTVVTIRGLKATAEGAPAAVKVSFAVKKTGKTSKFSYISKVNVVAKEEEKPAEVLGLKSVTQKTTTNFELTFAKELDKVAVADFKLVRDDDKADIQIKAAAVNTTDKTKVSLDTYLSLADGKSYTLTYTDADKKETAATFNVTDGKLAAFGLTPLKVTAGVATELKYQKLDANGMVLGEVKVGSPEANVTVEYKFTNTTASYADGDKVYLPNIGDKATVTVTKHTYQWNADQTEKDVIKGEFEVEAVASATTVDNYTFTISQREPAWEKLTSSNNRIALEDGNYKAFFKIVDSNNANVSDKYTVESADPSIIIANGNAGDGADLTPVKVGSTVLIVKDANGNSVKTANVQVVAKRVLSSVAVDRSSLKFASVATTAAVEKVLVSGSDQYGDYKAIDALDVIENFKVANNITVDDSANNSVSFTGAAACVVGSYSYTIKANDKIAVNVNVAVSNTTTGTWGYGFDFSQSSKNIKKYDITAYENGTGEKIRATLVRRRNGASMNTAATTVSVSALKVYRVGGDVYCNTGVGISRPSSSAAVTALEVNGMIGNGTTAINQTYLDIVASEQNADGAIVKNLVPGTYKVQATVNDNGVVYKTEDTFEVVDQQTALTASVISTSVEKTNDLTDALDMEDYIKLYDAKGKISTDDYVVVDVDAKFSGKTAYVKTIKIELTGDDAKLGATKVIVDKIAINRTFTTSFAGEWTK